MSLCEECARERGILAQDWSFPGLVKGAFSLSDVIGSLTSSAQEELVKSFKTAAKPKELRCPQCATTYAGFKANGFVGCAVCYETFYSSMREIIKRIHGSAVHVGSRYASGKPSNEPGAGGAHWVRENPRQELARLKKELEAALQKEAYEQAVVLRDRIRALGFE